MKIIKKAYPRELSIGLLLLIFVIAFFLSSQIFATKFPDWDIKIYLGMTLVGAAVIIMAVVLWEEFLFPIHIKFVEGGQKFRNHRNMLIKQLLIYLAIPAIFAFIYMEYEVRHVRYFIWAGICIISPIVGKLFSGLKNYNDFLTLTNTFVEYRNNEKAGKFSLTDIRNIKLFKDERNILHKVQLMLSNGTLVMIDLDEMELEAFYASIDEFITGNYKSRLS